MTTRSDVRFMADGGIELGAWVFLPASARLPSPAITMAHGYAGVREHGIAKFAEAFADAGFVVLLHDHRTFGVSGGEPRQDVDLAGFADPLTDDSLPCRIQSRSPTSPSRPMSRRINPRSSS